MSSRNDILARVRGHAPEPTPLPPLEGEWIAFEDRERQFTDTLTFVGGRAIVTTRSQIEPVVRELPGFEGAKQIVCTVEGIGLGNVDLNQIDDPHTLDGIDLAVLPGEFAVAENGAVWVSDKAVRQRTIYFITQHLVLVVPRSQVLDTLHEAYPRLSFEGQGYGLFISGPSKTADIEQSLVIGAHGPRSLTVLLVDG